MNIGQNLHFCRPERPSRFINRKTRNEIKTETMTSVWTIKDLAHAWPNGFSREKQREIPSSQGKRHRYRFLRLCTRIPLTCLRKKLPILPFDNADDSHGLSAACFLFDRMPREFFLFFLKALLEDISAQPS